MPDKSSLSFNDFISQLLHKNPNKRISIENALNHPLITGDVFLPKPWKLVLNNPFPIMLKEKQQSFFTSYPFSFIQSIIPIDNDKFIICNQKNSMNTMQSLYIYNIKEKTFTEISGLSKEINHIVINTFLYNKQTNTFSIYDEMKRKFIEYNLTNNSWKGIDRWKYEPKGKIKLFNTKPSGMCGSGNVMEFNFENGSEQIILINNKKLHIFSGNPYKHWICDYFVCLNHPDLFYRNEITKNDKFDDDFKIKTFNSTTPIIYVKSKQCLYVFFSTGIKRLYKYSILNKKWTEIDINIHYIGLKAILLENEKYILFHSGYHSYLQNPSRDILIFNIETETIIKSKIKVPFKENGGHYN
eukprot:366950_1